METIQTTQKWLNEVLIKSFDNIMAQQIKMDNKAYIFVGFLGAFLGVLNKDSFIHSPINYICVFTIIIYVLSLLPIATKIGTMFLDYFTKKTIHTKHNIFYYVDIYGLSVEDFRKVLAEEYALDNLSMCDIKFMEQIIINAEILKHKVSLHNFAMLFFTLSIILWGGFLILQNLKCTLHL